MDTSDTPFQPINIIQAENLNPPSRMDADRVTELELQMWRLFYGFLRWQEECEKNANGTLLSGNELAILHIVKMNNRSKTITDIERLLNRDDIHNIRYSLNKLLKLGLIKKTLSNYNGKNYLFEVTEAGIRDIHHFISLRQSILINMFHDLKYDLETLTRILSKLRAVYDEADRSLAQTLTYPKQSHQGGDQPSKPKGRVLVVEDHPTAAKVTKQILSDLNYHVDIAGSGDMAINMTEQYECDIIFMDIGLPDIDGYCITRKIRSNKNSKNTETPIIGLTVHNSSKNQKDCLDAGMNAVFTKPLIKEKASEIFGMFIKQRRSTDINILPSDTLSENKMFHIKGDVIDLSQGAKLVGGNETLAREAIEMLVESFSEELYGLEQSCISLNIENAQLIIHKLLGGISYCGVPRLSLACLEFNKYLKTGETKLIPNYFKLLKFELHNVNEKLSTLNLHNPF